ncbi:helix-turn-helix domain-containing protein [Rubrobacter aplysinae]|uniref:helix-turn-helix domain-containing protein n=1 Tax=Rubrobacter aplysinae TaxID=909625 RepID=UPI00064C1B31|nr:helix-turn-helix transcriptional regulator [Rubrobacter aplysinae]
MDHAYGVDTEKLRKAREEANLTVAELALESGVDAYSLTMLEEQGYVPPLTTLRGIAGALGLPTHTVIEWSPDPLVWNGREGSA